MPKKEELEKQKEKVDITEKPIKKKTTTSNGSTKKTTNSSKTKKEKNIVEEKIEQPITVEKKVTKLDKIELNPSLKKQEKMKKMVSDNKQSKNSNKKNETNEFRTLEVGILVLLTCIISLVVGSGLGIKFSEKRGNNEGLQTIDPTLQNFIKEYNYLIDNYYGNIDKKELLNTAFKSMVDTLEDSYSGTIDESASNNFDIELEGYYDGLGVEIINDENKNIIIYGIIPNSPASRTDLQKNDKLITVNGKEVSGMTTTDFIKNIVKESGAKEFEIVFERNGEQKTVVLKKEGITLQSVTSKIYQQNGKKIGYLKVTLFAANTYDQFKKELNNLEKEGMDSLLIDLRDNNGGHLTTVQDMISLFLDSSHVIYQTETKNKVTKVYSTGKETKTYPIAIVGNAMSASASEVMIGALTEEYGAALIGNQTFGKGTVQELHKLSNGDEYKFTTKKWLTPNGKWVHNNGIEPTIEVVLAKEYYGNPVEENDNQLKTALNYLGALK